MVYWARPGNNRKLKPTTREEDAVMTAEQITLTEEEKCVIAALRATATITDEEALLLSAIHNPIKRASVIQILDSDL